LPHDVHPVQIAYRRDIFAKYGIDVSKIKTWDDFIKIGHKLTIPGKQYMLEASDSDNTALEPLLLQRGGGYFDANGNVTMDNDIAVQTMCWFVPLVAGPNKISNYIGANQAFNKAVEDGYLLCYICPDWRTKIFEETIGHVSGKMALMPLPTVAPGTRPTTTYGGTMVGIAKASKNPDLTWQLVMFFYLNAKGVNSRFLATNILPPVRAQWKMPVFHQQRAYWSGIRLGDSYAKVAPYVPERYSNAAGVTAQNKLGQSVVDCVHY
jgi:ABC-type glycerol-3-phosphate transport system substrate-binding protein